MERSLRILTVGTTALLVACSERTTTSPTQAAQSSAVLDAAFTSTPVGFQATTSTYSGASADTETAYTPDEHHGERGRNGLEGDHDFMGGGLGPDFFGGPFGGGKPFDGRALPSSCAFSAATGVVTCPAQTRRGLTILRSAVYKDAAGNVQPAVDSTTNAISLHVDVSGTVARRDSTVITTVKHTSDQTITGLAKGSTQRVVNGTSAGRESSTGTDTAGTFSVVRTIGDTTTNLVIPVSDGKKSFPAAGTIVRAMSATLSRAGSAVRNSSRREVITFNGTTTATIVVTQDGTTKTCTLPLPHGRPTCQ
jgi:hypothetical protein